MSGVQITPTPTPDVAAAIVAALGAMGGGHAPGPADRYTAGWARRARRDEVWARAEMFETWGVGGGTR